MKNLGILILIVLVFGSLAVLTSDLYHNDPVLAGAYQSERIGLHHILISFHTDESRFAEYINDRLVNEGHYENLGDNTYKLEGHNKERKIVLEADDSFNIIIDKISGNQPIL